MKAGQLTGPRRLELVETKDPVPQDGEVLVQLHKVSICGSDLRLFDKVLPEESYPLDVGRPNHECIGVVVDSRSEDFKEGQQVIVLPTNVDGLREYLVEPPKRIVPIPDDGDLETYLMCQHAGTVLHSCNRIGSVVGKRVIVLGQGAIGLNFTAFLSRMGARDLIAADRLRYRLERSKQLGANAIVDASQEDTIEAINELTDGEGADLVVVATGDEQAIRHGVYAARLAGTIVFYGHSHEDIIRFPYQEMFQKALTCMATVSAREGTTHWAVAQAVDMVCRGHLETAHLITHRMKFEDMQKAYTMFAERQDGVIKVILDL